MTDDELVEVYIYLHEPHVDIGEMSSEEYADYKKIMIDTLGFAIFKLRYAVDELTISVIDEVEKVFTGRK